MTELRIRTTSAADLARCVTLHYAEQGDPDGEAIIFLHGYSETGHAPHRGWPEHFVRDLEALVQQTPSARSSAAGRR